MSEAKIVSTMCTRMAPRSHAKLVVLTAFVGFLPPSASASAASAWLTTVEGYDGEWRTFGRISVKVQGRHDGDVTNRFHILLEDADPECAKPRGSLGQNACRFAVHHGTDCSEIGQKLWHTSAQSDPWEEARYNTSADGTARGEIVVNTGLDQLAMYNHVIVLTDSQGVAVACGSVSSSCKRYFGLCFFEWLRIATGIATVVAVINSLWLMRKHLLYNSNPILCRYTSRILLMVPIYSIQAFVSLWLQVSPTTAEWLRFCREFYEAIVIFSFLQFILICVGGSLNVIERFDGQEAALAFSMAATGGGGAAMNSEEDEDCAPHILGNANANNNDSGAAPDLLAGAPASVVNRVRAELEAMDDDDDDDGAEGSQPKTSENPELGHICPWKWFLPPWRSARQMLQFCTRGTLTYVFVGMTVPVVTLVCRTFLRHHELEEAMKAGKILFMISSMIAINSLFELAHIFLPELKDLSPVAKFFSVKMVVFFTFWQGILLRVLQNAGLLSSLIDIGHSWTSDSQIAQALQNAAICIEMCLASVAHHWAFPPTDYRIVRKKLKAARSNSLLGVGLDEQMRRGFQVMDFRDIFAIAWNGFAPERFTAAPVQELDCGANSGSDGDATTTDSDSQEDSDTSSDSEELERGVPPSSETMVMLGSPIATRRVELAGSPLSGPTTPLSLPPRSDLQKQE